jgi:hypothetical protein
MQHPWGSHHPEECKDLEESLFLVFNVIQLHTHFPSSLRILEIPGKSLIIACLQDCCFKPVLNWHGNTPVQVNQPDLVFINQWQANCWCFALAVHLVIWQT